MGDPSDFFTRLSVFSKLVNELCFEGHPKHCVTCIAINSKIFGRERFETYLIFVTCEVKIRPPSLSPNSISYLSQAGLASKNDKYEVISYRPTMHWKLRTRGVCKYAGGWASKWGQTGEKAVGFNPPLLPTQPGQTLPSCLCFVLKIGQSTSHPGWPSKWRQMQPV